MTHPGWQVDWQDEVRNTRCSSIMRGLLQLQNGLRAAGQRQGKLSACLFTGTNAKGWIHGNDILILGSAESSSQLEQNLSKEMMVTVRARLGWGPKDDNKVTLLNRIIELKTDGDKKWIQYPRHVQIALSDLGLGKFKPVGTPGSNAKKLSEGSGKGNEQPNIYGAWARLKRVGRYLAGSPRSPPGPGGHKGSHKL
eukprot:4492456-Amphidinium_carterae.4